MSLTIHCKYKCFDSTAQRAEDTAKVSFLPFAVNVMLNLSYVSFKLSSFANYSSYVTVMILKGIRFLSL